MACTCVGLHGIDARRDLFHGKELLEVHLLPRQVRHARVRALEAHQDVALELVFCALQFFLTQRRLFQLRATPP